jgi:threonine dehydrogenase-like Zn-dependent dehydrogenase
VPARLSGTWNRSRRRQETVELLAGLPLAQLCTHSFGFADAAEAFRAVDEGKPGLMHAVLNYDRSAAGDL